MTVYEDDEIDLRPYIQALFKKWWLMVILAIMGAILGFIISQVPADRYEATAIILLTKQTSKLSLASQFSTTTEASDIRSRTDTIITIAESDAIALQVMEAIKDQWPNSEELSLEAFKKMIQVEAQADTLVLTSAAPSSTSAEALANTWAQILINTINQAYSGEQPLEIVQTQLQVAQVDYENAQTTLEEFLQNSQIEMLEQKFEVLTSFYNELGNDRSTIFNYYKNRKNDMLMLEVQAEGLKAQLERGNRSTAGDIGDALAVLFARATTALNLVTKPQFSETTKETTTSSSAATSTSTSTSNQIGPAFTLQISDLTTPLDTSANYLADVEAVIEQVRIEQEKAEAKLLEIIQGSSDDQIESTLNEIATQLQNTKALLESEQATFTELENNRDLSWTAYQALLTKETEIKNGPKESNFVALVSPAVLPSEAEPRGTLRNMLFGIAAGIFISICLVMAVEWWQIVDIFANKKESTTINKDKP